MCNSSEGPFITDPITILMKSRSWEESVQKPQTQKESNCCTLIGSTQPYMVMTVQINRGTQELLDTAFIQALIVFLRDSSQRQNNTNGLPCPIFPRV